MTCRSELLLKCEVCVQCCSRRFRISKCSSKRCGCNCCNFERIRPIKKGLSPLFYSSPNTSTLKSSINPARAFSSTKYCFFASSAWGFKCWRSFTMSWASSDNSSTKYLRLIYIWHTNWHTKCNHKSWVSRLDHIEAIIALVSRACGSVSSVCCFALFCRRHWFCPRT